jgi:hypothetical protein
MYKLFLVTHIVGVTIMAGTTFVDFVLFNYFWKTYSSDKSQGTVLEKALSGLQKFMGIGMLLIILSGIGMMFYLHQVWGQQLWFRIKMGILLLIIFNGLGLRRMLGSKLRKLLTEASQGMRDEQLYKVKSNMRIVHILQMLFFVTIFFLSVFKFN